MTNYVQINHLLVSSLTGQIAIMTENFIDEPGVNFKPNKTANSF